MPNIGVTELVLILFIAIILFGAKSLPQLGKAAGEAIHAFRKYQTGKDEEYDRDSIKNKNVVDEK